MLKIKGLQVNYGGIQAAKGLDLEIVQGELVTLIGANGAGKTTMKAITGVKPYWGANKVRANSYHKSAEPETHLVVADHVGCGTGADVLCGRCKSPLKRPLESLSDRVRTSSTRCRVGRATRRAAGAVHLDAGNRFGQRRAKWKSFEAYDRNSRVPCSSPKRG